MTRLSYPKGDLHKINITQEGIIVGGLSYDSVFDEFGKRSIESESDSLLLTYLEEIGTVMVLNFGYISTHKEQQGIFSQALRIFEKDVLDFQFKSLALIVHSRFKESYISKGYYVQGYLSAKDTFVMRKDLA